jgi:hypothetical protein
MFSFFSLRLRIIIILSHFIRQRLSCISLNHSEAMNVTCEISFYYLRLFTWALAIVSFLT